jgi:hypothetical protein
MFLRAALLGSLLFSCVLAGGRSAAADAPSAEEAADAKTTEARRHFKNGVKLYQDQNYAGALAEFEAAYEDKPGPGSLQNVALCQKALVRYAEAADTLTLLLERHGSDLTEEEKTAARTARDELEAAVGSIVVRVSPSHARLLLDGRALDAAALGAPIRAAAGEHALVAEAPGFARLTRTVRVVGGTRDVPIELALTPVAGFLTVKTSDSSAVVAIDGRPLGMGGWSGPVSPDEEHLVQVYRTGYEPFETRVSIAVGETKTVLGTLGARADGTSDAPTGDQLPPPPAAKPKLGWYSIAGFNVFGRGPAPLHFDGSAESTSGAALSLNLRLGRGVKKTVGIEMMLDAGSLNVEGACDTATTPGDVAGKCGTPEQISRNYQLGWFRVGPALRLSTPTEHWRGNAAFGAGAVWHELRIAAHAEDENRKGGKADGWGAFLLLEVGVSYHFGHLSIGLDLAAQVDGASSLAGDFDGTNQRAFDRSGNILPLLGIGLRAGYSQWSSEKRTP